VAGGVVGRHLLDGSLHPHGVGGLQVDEGNDLEYSIGMVEHRDDAGVLEADVNPSRVQSALLEGLEASGIATDLLQIFGLKKRSPAASSAWAAEVGYSRLKSVGLMAMR